MTYKEKLQLPEWKAKRQEILKRDDCKCQSCGYQNKSNHIHHTAYIDDREPWEYPNYLLLTLCEKCHEKEEFLKDFDHDNLMYLLKLGVTRIELNTVVCKLSQLGDLMDERYLAKSFIEHLNKFEHFENFYLNDNSSKSVF
jgi:hypothetical protein